MVMHGGGFGTARWGRRRGPTAGARGFTLIELLVVLAILALLLTIATPRYIQHVERAREATLRSSLKVMREAIDKFQGDQGRLPASLDELVSRSYLKAIPVDPITDRRDSWVVLGEAEVLAANPSAGNSSAAGASNRASAPGIADVRSGAPGKGDDGTAFADW
jgi:prepilin-type N-terminal cleavage/methylation domain-containing protein